MRTRQKMMILVYFVFTALLLGATLMLGSRYIGDNTAAVPSEPAESIHETDENPIEESDETEKEAVSTDMFTDTDLPETQHVTAEYNDGTEAGTETGIPEETEYDPVRQLMLLLEENAPLRWKIAEKTDTAEETADGTESAAESYFETAVLESELSDAFTVGETEPIFELVYPKLAYYYKDLATGTVVSYNADEILYSASLIKAPYIFAVLEEIDAFEESKKPKKESVETDHLESAAAESDPAETQIPAETDEFVISYLKGEEKYNLDEIWRYDPETMMEEGSGEIQYMPAGTEMTWRELFEYAILYSDNIAFAQIRERFGYTSFYKKVWELGISGVPTGFMNLSAKDCAVFLEEMYTYFETDSKYAHLMRDCMARSKHVVMIAMHYPTGTAVHKYGWDLGAYHDMAILYDENPYILVIMTDYEDGGKEPNAFIGDVVALTKEIHASLHTEPEETAQESDVPDTQE